MLLKTHILPTQYSSTSFYKLTNNTISKGRMLKTVCVFYVLFDGWHQTKHKTHTHHHRHIHTRAPGRQTNISYSNFNQHLETSLTKAQCCTSTTIDIIHKLIDHNLWLKVDFWKKILANQTYNNTALKHICSLIKNNRKPLNNLVNIYQRFLE